MTPQEQQLVNELFSRLIQLESVPRDPQAERLIADGVKKAPNAAYALVQTALVQNEALKRANELIQELQAQLDDSGRPQRQQGGFLDNMREALFGGNERASVPTAGPQAARPGSAGTSGAEPQSGYSPPGSATQPYSPAGPTLGSGGSFLGTAAAAAAGVIGGGLLRSMFASGGRRQDAALSEGNSGNDAIDDGENFDDEENFDDGDNFDDGENFDE